LLFAACLRFEKNVLQRYPQSGNILVTGELDRY